MAEYIDLDTPLELYVEHSGFCKKQISTLRDLLDINRIPYNAADVIERKRGKWEVIDVANLDLAYGGRIYVPEFKCNQCGSYYESDIRWVEPIMPEDAHFPKFCPYCGADMRGRENG